MITLAMHEIGVACGELSRKQWGVDVEDRGVKRNSALKGRKKEEGGFCHSDLGCIDREEKIIVWLTINYWSRMTVTDR